MLTLLDMFVDADAVTTQIRDPGISPRCQSMSSSPEFRVQFETSMVTNSTSSPYLEPELNDGVSAHGGDASETENSSA